MNWKKAHFNTFCYYYLLKFIKMQLNLYWIFAVRMYNFLLFKSIHVTLVDVVVGWYFLYSLVVWWSGLTLWSLLYVIGLVGFWMTPPPIYDSWPQSATAIFLLVLPLWLPQASIFLMTSIPSTTVPKTTWRLSNQVVLTVVTKNWEPFVLGPALACRRNDKKSIDEYFG